MQVDDIAASELAAAAPVLTELNDAQFNARRHGRTSGRVSDIGRGADPIVDLTWWVVAIAGCVGLAICIAVALLQPMDAERRHLRPLANVGRLTRLPEYRARRPAAHGDRRRRDRAADS